jgi:NADP-reducing hydrogenase subunit HndA
MEEVSMQQKLCSCQGHTEEQQYQHIVNIIDAYKDKPGSLIQVLHLAQGVYGFLPLDLQKIIAARMQVSLSTVSGVVSFYSFFSTTPKGDHTIRVCLGTACYVRGANKLVSSLTKTLGVDVGGTTDDRLFTLEIARCIGACGLAPAMMIGDKVYKQVSPVKLGPILAAYKEAGAKAESEGGAAS